MSFALANASSFQNGPGAANGAANASGADALAAFAQSLGGAAIPDSSVPTFKQCIAEALLASAKQSNSEVAGDGAQGQTPVEPGVDGAVEEKPFFPIFHGSKIHAPKAKSDAQSDAEKLIADAARGAGEAPGLSLLQAIAARNGMRVESAPLQAAPLGADGATETFAAPISALGRAANAAAERNALNQTAVANHAAARSAAAVAATSEEVSPLFLKLSGGGEAAQNGAGANAATGSGARVWQLQELGVQLGNALKSVLGQKAARTTPGQSAGLRGSLERMANLPGVQNRPGMAGDGNAEVANGRSAGQTSNGGGAQFGAEKSAAKLFAAGAVDHAPAKEIPAADSGANATSANQSAAPLGGDATWTAQPVRAGEHFIRQPRLLEQVRQAADFIAQRAEGAVKLGEGHVEAQLRLYPPSLGEVRVNLTMNGDGTAAAKFVAARPEAAALLNNHMQEFRDSVARHGLSLDQVQVSVAARAVGASGSAQNSQWQNSQWQGAQNQNASSQNGNAREDGANPGEARRERAEGGAGNQANGGDARQSRREQDARRQAWQRPAYQ